MQEIYNLQAINRYFCLKLKTLKIAGPIKLYFPRKLYKYLKVVSGYLPDAPRLPMEINGKATGASKTL